MILMCLSVGEKLWQMVDTMEESVLVRKGVFNLSRRLESESENLLWLLLSVKNVKFAACAAYLPPNNSS